MALGHPVTSALTRMMSDDQEGLAQWLGRTEGWEVPFDLAHCSNAWECESEVV